MANYNVDIAVALKGAKQLTSFNREVKATSTNIDAFAKRLKSAAKDQNLLVRSFNELNNVLALATKNFNAAATGSQQQFAAARQLVSIEKELNKEYQERERVLQSITLKGQRSSILPGQSLFGQSVTPQGGASGRSRQILQEEQALQEALGRMEQRFAGAGNITPMELTGQSESIFRGQSVNIEKKVKETLENRKKSEKEIIKIRETAAKKREIKEKKLIQLRKRSEKLIAQDRERTISARGRIAPNVPTIGSLAGGFGGLFKEGGAFAATGGQRAKGALSNALIGGGFPLLFGQGAIGAAGGGIGGALGGALGGGFGFGLSIAGTAIAQQIQQTLDFRKSIRELNKEMEQMGISSNISGLQVRQLGKSLGITKEEAVKALQEFKRFGNDAVLLAKKFGGDFGRFDALAQANTVESALSAIRKINKDLTLEDELRFILSVQRKGVEATINDILTETLEKQKELDTAGFGQGVGGRKRPAVLKREKEQLNEINTENTQLIEKLTNIRDLNNEIRIASEESSFSIVKGLQDVNAEIRKLNSAQFQVVELSKTLGSAFSESFKGIIRGTMSVGEAFRNMFMRIADHFLDMAAQMMAAQISRGFMGLFANAFGGGFSILGGATNTSLSTAQQVGLDNALYGNTFPAGSFANGGYAQRGKSYLVGEKGPEMFTPGAVGGQVSPMGSTNIVVNVDASGSNVQTDGQGQQFGEALATAIQSEIIKQKRSGGLLA